MKLLINALTKLVMGFVLIGLMLFLPARTFNYLGAWLFLGVLLIPVMIMGVVLFIKAPDLLEKRLNRKEKETAQKGVIALSGLMFIGGFVLSALDFRFGWSYVPLWLTITAAVVFLAGYGIFAEVMRERSPGLPGKGLRISDRRRCIPRGTDPQLHQDEARRDPGHGGHSPSG